MGHKHTSILLAALMCVVASAASAYDAKINGIYYNFSGTTATVTYQAYLSSSYTYKSDYSGNVTIPESVTYNEETYSVTSIGESAFNGCSKLTSIEIPNSVTSIGSQAFSGCSVLTSVTIPESVTSIGYLAFQVGKGLTSIVVKNGNPTYDSRNGCNAIIETASNTLIAGCKNTIIPNSVTSIGERAFAGCTGLTSIEIPNSVTSIGTYTFYGCSGLTSVEIGNSVTSIGSSAFRDCSGLTSIEIPNSVTLIGERAFAGCSGLTSIEIPNSVTSISGSAFSDCTGLTSVVIPNSVTSISGLAFYGCTGLTSVTVAWATPIELLSQRTFSNASNATLYVPKGTKEAYKAAQYWKNFKEIVEYETEETEETGIEDEHEYVDLGLPSGTLWATCNVGANSPEDYGDYFAWGETETKSVFTWSTYKYCNGASYNLTKYNFDSEYGIVDNLRELNASDDVAYVNWGSQWRIPTVDQFSELINSKYTTTTWELQNGTYGRRITSNANGNSIFLPAAGQCWGTNFEEVGETGFYWSCWIWPPYAYNPSNPDAAFTLRLHSNKIRTSVAFSRAFGQSIRPVTTIQTGVNDINNSDNANHTEGIYDLSGRRMNVNGNVNVNNSRLKKGIYIVNGKKVVK